MYSMAAKLSKEHRNKSPGPGSYNDMRQSHYDNLSGSKIGRDQRKSFFLYDSTHYSPLGRYNSIDFASRTLGAPNYGFGSS